MPSPTAQDHESTARASATVPRSAADALLVAALAAHARALRAWFGEPGGTGGTVRASLAARLWSVGVSDDGGVTIERSCGSTYHGSRHGPGATWTVRAASARYERGARKVYDKLGVDAGLLAAELTAELALLRFTAGTAGTAMRCSLCARAPVCSDPSGHFALCGEHRERWLASWECDRSQGLCRFVMGELGFTGAACMRRRHGQWEALLAAGGLSARQRARH